MMLLWLAALAQAAEVDVVVRQRGDGLPIADAEITLPDGTVVATPPDGRITLDLPDDVPAELTVQSWNHQPVTVSVTPPLDGPLRIFLMPMPGPAEVVVEAFRPTADLTRHVVDAEMATRTPGTYDDAVRLVQAMPGVNVQREFAPNSGDIQVRGSLPGQSRAYLDGIDLPYLYHFNQYASVFPASWIDTIELFSSTFGSHYGDAVGAIIEANTRQEAPEEVGGQVHVNMITLGADITAPLKKGWWISGAARRSFHDIAGESSLQYPFWPRFYDFSVRANHADGPRRSSVYVTGAGDAYERAVGELDIADPVEQASSPYLAYRRDYQMAGGTHAWQHGRLSTAFVHDQLQARITEDTGHLLQRRLRLPLRLDAGADIGDHWRWLAGTELRPEILMTDLADPGPYGELVTTEAPELAWDTDFVGNTFRMRSAAYGEFHWYNNVVRVIPGIRLGLDTQGWTPTIEPRFSARWRVAEQTELRLATGRYQQRPSSPQAQILDEDTTTDSWQIGVGLDQTFGGRLELSVEGYTKALANVFVQPPDGVPELYRKGLVYGGELTLRYRLRDTLFAWAWISAGRAFVFDTTFDDRVPMASDQPIAGGMVLSWDVTQAINVAVRYRGASGLPYTGILGSTFDAAQDAWLPRYAALNGDRMPAYHKLDLHFGYSFFLPTWRLDLYADLWFVPPASAQLYPTWNYDYTEEGFVTGPVFLPLLGVRASF